MRSLVSMFWPSPFVTRELPAAHQARPSFVSWYGNSVIVSVSEHASLATAIGTRRRLRAGPASSSSAAASWRAPRLITYLVPPSILFIPLYAQIKNAWPRQQPLRADR